MDYLSQNFISDVNAWTCDFLWLGFHAKTCKTYASMVSKVKNSMSNQIWGTHQQILQVKMSPCGDFRAWMRNMLVILSPCRPLFGELDKVNSSVCAMFWDSSLMFLSITQTPTRTSGSFAWYHRIPTVTGFLWHFRKLKMVNWSLSPPPAKNNVPWNPWKGTISKGKLSSNQGYEHFYLFFFHTALCIPSWHHSWVTSSWWISRRSGGEMIVTWGPDSEDDEEASAWP